MNAFVSTTGLPVAAGTGAAALRVAPVRVAAKPFMGARLAVPAATTARAKITMEYEFSEGEMFDNNPLVLFLALAGWILPSSIPAGIPLTEGTGLSQAFLASIQRNLANWPAGPAATDPFWTLCFLWHLGMIGTLIFGSIGYNIRKNQS
eukprot:CAMPEP_0198313018 /NCGR_PEP_ID=MMETSP1450-20131203/4178_1 /TAXON_ID=753684 ORGANISM="Madagascaria erythrocladiodes, Strain CCMP3234" /NCGR_SAMPLE_ID=MMETSP1450 /ASSEMBLY_ACC=CAM_ASM_001115 /LENGTH=148 /DNA_ID=CAMNT_0044015987 /DNA_START=101 /DNA_END=547 /DNA_ORIENTATION=-